jgi:hypothetical protein
MPDDSLHGIRNKDAGNMPTAGVILLVATFLEILAMAHHPSAGTPDTAQAVQEIARLAKLSALVHGVLMGLMLLVAYSFSEFALRRGLKGSLIRAGTIAYGAGTIVMLGAALVSGFVFSDLASLTPHVTAVDLQINEQLFILCRVLNRTCANFGVVAMSAGIGFWSVDLLRESGPHRMVGALGCIVGVFPVFALVCGLIHLDVHGMSAVVLLQGSWNVAIAVLLMRSSI